MFVIKALKTNLCQRFHLKTEKLFLNFTLFFDKFEKFFENHFH